MKNWMPFTDYDFYAYITSGMIVMFSLDYAFNYGGIMFRPEWPFMHVVFAILVAYIIGQAIASPASLILEHWMARRLLRPPAAVMMGFGKPVWCERFIGRWAVGRYYEPISEGRRSVILEAVAKRLGKKPEDIDDPEDVFQIAFPVARSIQDAAMRMDGFRNMYGFARNIALSGMIGAAALVYRAWTMEQDHLYWWVFGITVLSAVMFFRFLKFYAAYGAEVLRTYAANSKKEAPNES